MIFLCKCDIINLIKNNRKGKTQDYIVSKVKNMLKIIVLTVIAFVIVLRSAYFIFQLVDTDDREERKNAIIKFAISLIFFIVIGIAACKYLFVAIILFIFIGWLVR